MSRGSASDARSSGACCRLTAQWNPDEGAPRIHASGVGGEGSTIVGQGRSGTGFKAFIWTAEDRMQRLWDVLLASGVESAASGWSVLPHACEVSLNGSTIVGFGTRNGNIKAIVARVPRCDSLDFNGDGVIPDDENLIAFLRVLASGACG